MERYIKINSRWIDTLEAQKSGYIYYELEGAIWCLPENGMDYKVGKLEEERKSPITDTLSEFLLKQPNKGFKSYLKYCEENGLTPVKKSVFKKNKLILK